MYAPPPQLNLLVIRSPDIDRAATFYKALGLVITRHAHGGVEHYSSSVDGHVFEIYPLKPGSTATTSVRFGFVVDSVNELTPRLVDVGGAVLEAPHDSEWGRRAVVKDLDGHCVEIVSPSDATARPI